MMKIIIAQGDVSREIHGPYCICASAADLRLLRDCIEEWLDDKGKSYGWVEIRPSPFAEIPSSNPPMPWASR